MKKILKYLKPYWFFAIVSPLLMMGEVFADLMQPKLMSKLVDHGIANGDMRYTIRTGILMLLIVLIGGIFGTLCAYTATTASQGLGRDLRIDAYKKVMSLSIEQTDRFTTGSLVTRMTNDITMVLDLVALILRMFVRSPMFFIGGAIMMLTLNLKFGIVLLCSLPVLILLIVFVFAKSTPLFSLLQKKLDRVNCVVQENVSGARVVKAYVREDYENKRFLNANEELKNTNYHVLKLMAVFSPFLTLILNLSVLAIIYIGGFHIKIQSAGMTTGTIMAAITYITQILMSIMMISNIFQSISRAVASAKRITEILDTKPSIENGTYTSAAQDIAIRFENVSFQYPEAKGNPVLHDINLSIAQGETIAIIGSTGSGKTSLVQLIPRFYDTIKGDIYINDRSIKEYKLNDLREKIGYVMQKSELFSDTIANNIRYGKPDATMDEIIAAAKMAQAHDFIKSFENGYDTYIAQQGSSLSGGQKQRISIARALIRHPEILILDDSTSALDLVTENKVQKSLKETYSTSTIIMIAQRIASVKNCDRIAVIEDGTIKHCASHDELLKISPTYRDIYDSQMSANSSEEGGVDHVE